MKGIKTLALRVKRIFIESNEEAKLGERVRLGNHEVGESDLSTLDEKALIPVSNSKWDVPRPLEPELEPVIALSPDMLPEAIYGHVCHEAKRINNAPPEYVAVSVITAAASVIGASASIKPKRFDEWEVRQAIWGLFVGAPSSYKTPCMSVGTSLISKIHDRIITPANELRKRNGAAKKKLLTKQIKILEDSADQAFKNNDLKLAESLLQQIEELKVSTPKMRNIVINDATPEALLKRVEENPNGILMVRDELFGLLNRLERIENSQERSIYLEAFNNTSSYSQDRLSRDDVFIERLGINILGGIQPGRLLPLMKRRHSGESDDGFFERLQLAVYPDVKTELTDIAKHHDYEERAIKAFACFAMMVENDIKVVARFSDTAQILFENWCCRNHENSLKSSSAHASVIGKYPSLLARLAHLFHLFDEADSTEHHEAFVSSNCVGEDSLNKAINFMTLLESHSRRIQSYWQSSSQVVLAQLLLPQLKELDTPFDLRTLQRKGWKGLTSNEDCRAAVDSLVENGYLRKTWTMGKSKKTCLRYEIHPDYKGNG
ncbi:YfjI family protein [Idiomarina loihiensis]|uniref:Uncharacterized conserved protein n=1 Tax=Idiomarina loihiensis (strain ATCC BAA-735 / DSM 15497 / L2-TR) TaxID=283942 RepID=Q5R0D8_IDILO|nr:YfjI family protein [Idiomarina loihiensis]AAV81525.1 Uncharacterized conserved protein [Idiomarina loihiensis L2TR]AGM35553.1 hypothetical protein K734_03430 [Idiomarina loihiensis GSL 199]